MRDVVLVFSFILSLPTVFIRPWIGLIIWTVFSYLNPHRMCFGFAARFPFAAITAAVTICALIIHRQLRPFKLNSAVVLLVLLIAWTNITYLFALNPEDASVEWSRFMKIQLMGFVTMAAITEFRKLQVLIWATALSIAFFGVKGGLFTLATGGQHHVIGPPSTFIADNNNLALALVMTLPLLRYVQLTSRRRWVRFALGGMMALCVVSVMGSYSRAGVLSMGVVVIMTVLKSRHKAVLAVAGAICLLAGVAFMPIAWQQRVQSINNYEQDASSLGRINAWNFAGSSAAGS